MQTRDILVDANLAYVVSVISSGELDIASAVFLSRSEILRLLAKWCEGSNARAEDCKDYVCESHDG